MKRTSILRHMLFIPANTIKYLNCLSLVFAWFRSHRERKIQPTVQLSRKSFWVIFLLLIGIESNPNPASKYPCGSGKNEVEDFGQQDLACNTCDQLSQIYRYIYRCIGISSSLFDHLINTLLLLALSNLWKRQSIYNFV